MIGTFRRAIEFETLANQPTRAFLQPGIKNARGILKCNSALYLSHRMKAERGAYAFLPRYPKKMIDAVSPVLPGSDYNARRQQSRGLCELLAKEMGDADVLRLLITKAPETSARLKDIVSYPTAGDAKNVIAAAAGVGNLSALRAALHNDPDQVWTRSPTFSYPLAATAVCGRLEVVRSIVKYFEHSQNGSHLVFHEQQFHTAISGALKGKHSEIVLLLLKVLDVYGEPIDDETRKSWNSLALSTRNRDVIRKVSECRQDASDEFFKACEEGDLQAVRMFIKEGMVPLQLESGLRNSYVSMYQLDKAIIYGKAKAVKEVLRLGADPNGNSIKWAQNLPLWLAIILENEILVRNLLKYGADPRPIMKLWWERDTSHWVGRLAVEMLLVEAERRHEYYEASTDPITNFAANAEDLVSTQQHE